MNKTGAKTAGLVFAGGQSQRMGSDKAILDIGGQPLITRVLDALHDLGSVTIVGGDERNAVALGQRWCTDEYPGEGPLGALITGIRSVAAEMVVSSACDLPYLQSSTVAELVSELRASDGDVAVPLVGGRMQWHLAAWRTASLGQLERAFDGGERSFRGAAQGLRTVAIVFAGHQQFIDLDTPADVEREFPG